jgi:hypothetical protein
MKRFSGILAAILLTVSLSTGTAAASGSEDHSVSAFCNGNAVGIPGKWGAVSSQCSFTSPPSWRGYIEVNWWVEPGTQQYACVEGRMGSVRETRPWQSLGCGKSGKGQVAWDKNTLAMLEIHVKSVNVALAMVNYEI